MANDPPLIDSADGSPDDLLLAMWCDKFARLSDDERETAIDQFRGSTSMSEVESVQFKRDFIEPMIERYHQMLSSDNPLDRELESQSDRRPDPAYRKAVAAGEPHPVTGPDAPCLFNSGKKYKFLLQVKTNNLRMCSARAWFGASVSRVSLLTKTGNHRRSIEELRKPRRPVSRC